MTYYNPGSTFTGIPNIPGFTPPTVNGASTAADYLAATGGAGGAGAGGGGGFLSNMFASNIGPKFLGGTGEMGLMRAGLPAAAGLAATYGINKLLPTTGGAGNMREILADAATGAGIGGTVGSIFPGIGTGIGAAVGGGAGGLYGLAQNLFGSNENASTNDAKSTISAAAIGAGQDPGMYSSKFDLWSKTGMPIVDANGNVTGTTKDPTAIANALGKQIYVDRAQKQQSDALAAQQAENHKADLMFGLAYQDQAQKFMTPYVNNLISGGVAQAKVLNQLADQMPAAYKGVFQSQAANALNYSQQIGGAYMGQMMLQPSMQAMAQTSAANNQELANQAKLFQYASQMQGGQGGGGGGIQSLLAAGGQFNAANVPGG